MSRIRSIHPGLFTDESFMTLTVEAPLAIPLLLGIWAEADDDGVFEWKPLTLKVKTIPATGADTNELMGRLASLNFIRRFDIGDKSFGAIRNFKDWQRPKQPKVKFPKADWVAEYVGGRPEPVPHDFPTDTEISSQREDGGGRMKDEDITDAPQSEPSRARTDFSNLKAIFPINPKSNLRKAEDTFGRLPTEEQVGILAAAEHYRKWFIEDNLARNRPSTEGLVFVPHLVNWIRSGDWRKVEMLPLRSSGDCAPDLVVLHAEDELFKAIQRARGKPIIVGKNGTATFTKAEVERAIRQDSDAA